MNERFVAVSTVTGSRICGCFSKPKCNVCIIIIIIIIIFV